MIKIFKIELPTLEKIARFNQKYQILSQLNSPEIGKYELIKYQNCLALILEDFGGISLRQFIATKKLSTRGFWQIASAALAVVHKHNIVYKDIKSTFINQC